MARSRASLPDVGVVDFETEGIRKRPEYPPKPVGVALELPGEKPVYMAWGHPVENNCTKDDAKRALRRAYDRFPMAFHNSKFDLDVGNTHLGLPLLPPRGYHDTEFLAFLDNPHNKSLALKPLAVQYLGLAPVERDAVKDWILSNIPGSHNHKGKDVKNPELYWAALICKAPGKLVGRYAVGDITRTKKLLKLLHRQVVDERGMREPYERDLRLMPYLLENERGGIVIDAKMLERDARTWEDSIQTIDQWLLKKLKVSELNFDSPKEVAAALENAGFIGQWVYTENGNPSTSKENLPKAISDQSVLQAMLYRSKLETTLTSFGRPWVRIAERNKGRVHFDWNQVRNQEHGRDLGARSGRLQTTPNLLNVPKEIEIKEPFDPSKLNKALAAKICPLPMMRRYILADDRDQLFGHRDFSQQELRILGHYEGGPLKKAYLRDPELDMHVNTMIGINKILNRNFSRRPIKDFNFGKIYGMGLPKTALKMGVDMATAKLISEAHRALYPGIGELIDDLKARARRGEPFFTWGGRQYYCEDSVWDAEDGRWVSFEYKMLNYLIQGSAADCTKEAWMRVCDALKHSRVLLAVHDEINASMPRGDRFWKEMRLMREAMESIEFSIPMLSDGGVSKRSWAEVRDFKNPKTKKYEAWVPKNYRNYV